jgi:hypothetical protein
MHSMTRALDAFSRFGRRELSQGAAPSVSTVLRRT